MAASSPTRIDDDLFAAAKAAGAERSRSAAQQVNHWARLGRQLEASGALSQRDLSRVLSGRKPYDSLDAHAQAVVRAEWEARIDAAREGLDLTAELVQAGEDWVEAGPSGKPVVKRAKPAVKKPRRRSSAA